MPIFDYKCGNCALIYDVYHKGKELVEDIVCPSCGATAYTKLMSAPVVSMGSSSGSESSSASCEGGSCCGGSCGLN